MELKVGEIYPFMGGKKVKTLKYTKILSIGSYLGVSMIEFQWGDTREALAIRAGQTGYKRWVTPQPDYVYRVSLGQAEASKPVEWFDSITEQNDEQK